MLKIVNLENFPLVTGIDHSSDYSGYFVYCHANHPKIVYIKSKRIIVLNKDRKTKSDNFPKQH